MLFKSVSHERQREGEEPFPIQGDSQAICDPKLDPRGLGGGHYYKVHFGDKRQNWNGAYGFKYCISVIFPEFNNCTVVI